MATERFKAEQVPEKIGELPPRNVPRPQRRQMGRPNLAIDKSESAVQKFFCQRNERRFGGVADMGKHGLSEKASPQGNPIKPPGHHTSLPSLHRMGITHLMEDDIGLLHFLGDPGSILPRSWFLASGDHGPEILIKRNGEAFLS